MNGYGILKWPDDSQYKGNFVDGSMHGNGEYQYPDRRTRYNGEFKKDVWHGKGTLQYSNDHKYEGPFFNGMPHGQGNYTVGRKSRRGNFD